VKLLNFDWGAWAPPFVYATVTCPGFVID